jgi:hypothetical protein
MKRICATVSLYLLCRSEGRSQSNTSRIFRFKLNRNSESVKFVPIESIQQSEPLAHFLQSHSKSFIPDRLPPAGGTTEPKVAQGLSATGHASVISPIVEIIPIVSRCNPTSQRTDSSTNSCTNPGRVGDRTEKRT